MNWSRWRFIDPADLLLSSSQHSRHKHTVTALLFAWPAVPNPFWGSRNETAHRGLLLNWATADGPPAHIVAGGFISGHFISWTCLYVDVAVMKSLSPAQLKPNQSYWSPGWTTGCKMLQLCSGLADVQTQVICFNCKTGCLEVLFSLLSDLEKKKKKELCVTLYWMFVHERTFWPLCLQRHTYAGSTGCFHPPLGAEAGWLQIPGIAAVIWVQ